MTDVERIREHLSDAAGYGAAGYGDTERVFVAVPLAARAGMLLTAGSTDEQWLAARAIEAAALRAYGADGAASVAVHRDALHVLMGTACTAYASGEELRAGICEAVVFQGGGAVARPAHILRCLETIKVRVPLPLEDLLGSEHGLLDWQRNPTQPLHGPVPVRAASLDLLHGVTLTALSARGDG